MKKMNHTKWSCRTAMILIVAVLAIGFGNNTALAEQEISESGSASAKGMVYVENLAGSVKIKGWDKNEIEVTGTLDEKAKKLNFETGKKKSIIEVVYPRRVKNIEEGSHLVIMIPRGSSLEVECVSADVEISGVEGHIEVEAVSSNVEIDGPCLSTDVDVISGSVTLTDPGEEVEVDCISGQVQITGHQADVRVESISGEVSLDFDLFRNLSVESISGTMRISGDLDSSGSFALDLHSGNLILMVPSKVSADFEAHTFSGDIETDFGYEGEKTSKYLPGQELEFSTGGGGADVEINTFSGDINIRKK
ncbi:MAG: DUF4097 domain-containing protein [Gemmatimonadales bacterium]|nr:DUF4097 domain-containing protein [Gemmatimonadales bacterium]